jgi:hypothetical protein
LDENGGAVLSDPQQKGVWDLLECWIGRLLDAKDACLHAIFKEHSKALLPKLVDELDLWIRMELVTRQIGYPVYGLTLGVLFSDQFSEFAE